MPWTAESGKQYSLLYLDTNALSSLLKRPTTFGHALMKRFPPGETAVCHPIYTLIEVRRRPDLWDEFVHVFSSYPWFLTKPYSLAIEAEAAGYHTAAIELPLMRAFAPFGDGQLRDVSGELDVLFGPDGVEDAERRWRTEEHATLQAWMSNKGSFEPAKSVANAKDAAKYIEDCHLVPLFQHSADFVESELQTNGRIDASKFPTLQTMLLSVYYRLFDPAWTPKPQEVTDVTIASIVPYMDVFISERYQLEILRKARKHVKELESVELLKLRDIATPGA